MTYSAYYPEIADDDQILSAISEEKLNRDWWIRNSLCDIELVLGVRISDRPIHDLTDTELYVAMNSCPAMKDRFTGNYKSYLLFGHISHLLFMRDFTPYRNNLHNEINTIANIYSKYNI